MSWTYIPGIGTPADVLREAATEIEPVLMDAALAVTDPDYRGSQYLEVARGNRLKPVHVMVDFLGNVFHVARAEAETFRTESLTITYLPSWFYQVIKQYRRADAWPRDREVVIAPIIDRLSAYPLRITAEVDTSPDSARGKGTDPRIIYQYHPSEPAGAEKEGNPAVLERIHWSAPQCRIIAAPGVTLSVECTFGKLSGMLFGSASLPPVSEWGEALWGELVLYAAAGAADAAAAATARTASPVSTSQTLRLELERRQHASLLPSLDAPLREAGAAEADLLTTELARANAQWVDTTRPDGVDLSFLTSMATWNLQRQLTLAQSALEAVGESIHYANGTFDALQPVPVRIRVDPMSPRDRFVCCVSYLDDRGTPIPYPPSSSNGQPMFRLTVVRTRQVQVYADLRIALEGRVQLAAILDYREHVVDHADDVPLALDPLTTGVFPRVSINDRPWTAAEAFDVVMTPVGVLPFPATQVAADYYDYATLATYLVFGTDPFGRELSRWDFGITLGGILLPEAAERMFRGAARLARLRKLGAHPGGRMMDALEQSELADALLAIGPVADR